MDEHGHETRTALLTVLDTSVDEVLAVAEGHARLNAHRGRARELRRRQRPPTRRVTKRRWALSWT